MIREVYQDGQVDLSGRKAHLSLSTVLWTRVESPSRRPDLKAREKSQREKPEWQAGEIGSRPITRDVVQIEEPECKAKVWSKSLERRHRRLIHIPLVTCVSTRDLSIYALW